VSGSVEACSVRGYCVYRVQFVPPLTQVLQPERSDFWEIVAEHVLGFSPSGDQTGVPGRARDFFRGDLCSTERIVFIVLVLGGSLWNHLRRRHEDYPGFQRNRVCARSYRVRVTRRPAKMEKKRGRAMGKSEALASRDVWLQDLDVKDRRRTQVRQKIRCFPTLAGGDRSFFSRRSAHR
jgi:hypothetical protein